MKELPSVAVEGRLKQRVHRGASPAITPQRKRIFGIVVVSVPIFFFVLLEFFLRQFNYGPDLSLFTTEKIGGKSYYVMNPSVKNRYFSQFNFNPTTSREFFPVSKSPGTFRIFCLGGSTTIGYPYWYNGAFSSFLRDRLNALFPGRPIEVVNVGMTATNSFTVLDLSKDLMNYEPDLLIVYDGHNEFYGALGVASNEHSSAARWMTLLRLRAVHLRTFQLVENTIAKLLSLLGKTPIDYTSRVTMMERVARGRNVAYGSDLYVRALSIFRQNLSDLADRCRDRRVPLLLGTQVSNLRDQSPFISGNARALPEQLQSEFQRLYKRGVELQSAGRTDSAIVVFRSALAIDSLYADAHYKLGQCREAKGKKGEASREYVLARDYDELRFRTDTRFNDLIRSMEDHQCCFVVDLEAVFKCLSSDSLIGNDLIVDHLHPNARGHFLFAKACGDVMRKNGFFAPPEEWARCDTVTDDVLWNHRHVTDLDELTAARITEILTSGWPFRSQSIGVAPVRESDTLHFLAEQLVHDRISWSSAHLRAADYYQLRSDSIRAEKEYATVVNQFPLDVSAQMRLARFYYDHKAFPKAEAVLLSSLQVEQTSAAYRSLGDISLKQGRAENAIRYYEALNRFSVDPSTAPENAYVLSLAYLLSGQPQQAVRILEPTVARYPAYRPAQELLARIKMVERAAPVK